MVLPMPATHLHYYRDGIFVFKKANDFLAHLHGTVDYDLAPYQRVLADMERIKLSGLTDSRLREMSEALRSSHGVEDVEVKAFALAREAARHVLGLRRLYTGRHNYL
jgi:hypothetical protein